MKRRTLLSAAASTTVAPFLGQKVRAVSPTPSSYRSTFMIGAPTTADGFFQMFQNKNDMVWSGGDQGTSVVVDGYCYWIFGDTMLSNGEDPDGSYPEGTVMVGNSILMQQGDLFVNALANVSRVPDPATHNSSNQERYWTQGMFSANGFVYVLCQRVENIPGDFRSLGVELAKFRQEVDGRLTLLGMITTPCTGKVGGNTVPSIQWGNDAVVHSGYVYFYGAHLNGDPSSTWNLHNSYVARAACGEVENPFAWRFYKKTTGTWVSNIYDLDQNSINASDAITSAQVSSVRYINGKFVMLDKPWNGMGSTVRASTSTTPYGPWSTYNLFESPEGTNYNTYCPQLHPEQTLTSGKTLISIAWNGKSLVDVMADADLYKLRFHEFTF